MENPTPLKIWYALHLFATYLGINAILYLQGVTSLCQCSSTWSFWLSAVEAPQDFCWPGHLAWHCWCPCSYCFR